MTTLAAPLSRLLPVSSDNRTAASSLWIINGNFKSMCIFLTLHITSYLFLGKSSRTCHRRSATWVDEVYARLKWVARTRCIWSTIRASRCCCSCRTTESWCMRYTSTGFQAPFHSATTWNFSSTTRFSPTTSLPSTYLTTLPHRIPPFPFWTTGTATSILKPPPSDYLWGTIFVSHWSLHAMKYNQKLIKSLFYYLKLSTKECFEFIWRSIGRY